MAHTHDHGHDHAEEHKHGTMDITVQQQTFDSFIRFTTRTVIVIAVSLVLLAIFNG
jgi:hypothetical protein